MALEHRQIAPVYAVQYALRVLEAVDRHRHGVSADQLSREIGVPVDCLAHVLAMLRHERYVGLLPGGGYVVGESLVLLGSAGRDQAPAGRLSGVLAELRDDIGAAVYFGRYDDGEVSVVDYADGPATPAVNEWVDFRSSAHASAVGKCLLAQLDHDGRRDHLSRHPVARLTSRTVVNEKALLAMLESQPASQPTLDLQEYAAGTVCAAVPVTVGKAVACLAMSLPFSRIHRLKQAVDALNERAAPMLLAMTV